MLTLSYFTAAERAAYCTILERHGVGYSDDGLCVTFSSPAIPAVLADLNTAIYRHACSPFFAEKAMAAEASASGQPIPPPPIAGGRCPVPLPSPGVVAPTAAPVERRRAVRRRPPAGTACLLAGRAGLVWDISEAGAGLLLDQRPVAGETVPMTLATANGGFRLDVRLRVARSAPVRANRFFVGGRFGAAIPPSDLARITGGAAIG